MKRTLLVLALAVLSTAGCRAINSSQMNQCGQPYCGDACSNGCGDTCDNGCGNSCSSGCGDGCCESCHMMTARHAPRLEGCCEGCADGCGRGGNVDSSYPGGNCCVFDRYAGHPGGPGYHPGPYDCSPCGSPDWGCTGYRHPQGYVTGKGCLNCQNGAPCRPPHVGPHCPCCGHGYCCACCGPPAPGCPCCCCGASGDHNYNFNPGPPVAQTAYPYYTLRGPRDFLLDNPPSIGPY
jgi:hypothetical protein